jgi:hypothetical protein
MAEISNKSACNDAPGTDKLAKIEVAVELIQTASETSSGTEMPSTKMGLDSPQEKRKGTKDFTTDGTAIVSLSKQAPNGSVTQTPSKKRRIPRH